MKCSACSIEEARQVIAKVLGSYRGEVSPLCLPYESRDVGSVLSAIRRAIGQVHNKRFIVFIIPGLRCRLVVCSGHVINAKVVHKQVNDMLSGLRHKVPIVVISINSCVIEGKWIRTRFRLDPRSLEKCDSDCKEILL